MNEKLRNNITTVIFWILLTTLIIPIGFFIDTFNTDPANVELNELRYSIYVKYNPSKEDLHQALVSGSDHIDVYFNMSIGREYHDNLFTNYKLKKSMVEGINTNAQLNQDLWNYFRKDGIQTNNNISLIERKGKEQQHNFTLINSDDFINTKSYMSNLTSYVVISYILIIGLWIIVSMIIISMINEILTFIEQKKNY